MTTEAKFTDGCSHAKEEFIGTFPVFHRGGLQEYDLYVFWTHQCGKRVDQHVCIRYGDGEADYISPGSLEQFLTCASNPNGIYTAARKLLFWQGRLTWKRNPATGDSNDDL